MHHALVSEDLFFTYLKVDSFKIDFSVEITP